MMATYSNLKQRLAKIQKVKRNEYKRWNEIDEEGHEVLCIQTGGKVLRIVEDFPDDDECEGSTVGGYWAKKENWEDPVKRAKYFRDKW